MSNTNRNPLPARRKRPMRQNHPGGRLWKLSGQSNTYRNSMDRGWRRTRPQLLDPSNQLEQAKAGNEENG